MSFVFIISISIAPTTLATEDTSNSKISSELSARLETASKDEKIPVYIWTKDIDYAEVEEETEKELGYSYDTITALSNSLEKLDTTVETSKAIANFKPSDSAKRAELLQKVKDYRSEKREQAKERYIVANKEITDSVSASDSDILFSSQYAPMIIVSLTKTQIQTLSKNSNVTDIGLYADIGDSGCGCVDEDIERITETDTKDMQSRAGELDYLHGVEAYYNRVSLGLTGSGITIGMAEAARVDKTNVDELDDSTINFSGNSYDAPIKEDIHAIWDARMVVGSNGVVPNAVLYSASTEETQIGQFIAIESLINISNMDVIFSNYCWFNVNDSYPESDPRYWASPSYNNMTRWYEHVASQHNMTLVVPLGNAEYVYCAYTSIAYNVITLGGYDMHGTTSPNDDTLIKDYPYIDKNVFCSKPDFLAPAADVFGSGGTCAASAITTGVIAQMIQYDNLYGTGTLSIKPYLIKAILTASCNRKVLNANGTAGESLGTLTPMQGAGVISAEDAVEIIKNTWYYTGTANAQQTTNNFLSPSNNSRIRVALAWEKSETINSSHTLEPNSLVFNSNIPIANLQLALYAQQTSTNYSFVNFSNKANSSVELLNIPRVAANNNVYRAVITKPAATGYSPRYALAWY